MKYTAVQTFDELITQAGALQSRTEQPRHLYRGQWRAWPGPDGADALLPTFYREHNGPRDLGALKARVRATAGKLSPHNNPHVDSESVAEILLQHYEHTPTRVLDCTQILHVAASFALCKDWTKDPDPAVVYVINATGAKLNPRGPESGKPAELGAAIVPALTPVDARRPQVQAAWALYLAEDPNDAPRNFARWAVAAFTIDQAAAKGFWKDFEPYDCEWMMKADTMNEWFMQNLGLPPVPTGACPCCKKV